MGTGGPFPGVKRGRSTTLATHPRIMLRSRVRRNYTSSPHYRLYGMYETAFSLLTIFSCILISSFLIRSNIAQSLTILKNPVSANYILLISLVYLSKNYLHIAILDIAILAVLPTYKMVAVFPSIFLYLFSFLLNTLPYCTYCNEKDHILHIITVRWDSTLKYTSSKVV